MNRALGLAACLVGLAGSTCLGQGGKAPVQSEPEVPSPEAHELVEGPSSDTPRLAEPEGERRARLLRELGRSRPWDGSRITPYPLERDRDAARAGALALRLERRPYEGAPPPMPHSADFGAGTKQCTDCHTDGTRIGERVARPMSHAPLTNCTQCHVESKNTLFGPARSYSNGFEGAGSSSAHSVYGEGHPPPIPHGVWMRTRCLSCHGEFGYPGLRTSHPQRSQCMQCHLPESGDFR